mgnify:CR=1 FL=1
MREEKRNIYWHKGQITRRDRERVQGYKGCTLWLTGLSGSGKSTIAHKLEERLFERGIRSYVLDGDNIRFGLNKDLGFSREARQENIRRVAEVAKLFTDAGIINIIAFISPYLQDRLTARNIQEPGDFIEIYIKCPISICEKRDPKGIYKKARAGLIKEFTGIDDPYEEPKNPEIVIETDKESLDGCVNKIVNYLIENGYLGVNEK